MVPSSFIISQITPYGNLSEVAILARSTAASVCPALTKTPPSLAKSGNIWPGLTKSFGLDLGETATLQFVLYL